MTTCHLAVMICKNYFSCDLGIVFIPGYMATTGNHFGGAFLEMGYIYLLRSVIYTNHGGTNHSDNIKSGGLDRLVQTQALYIVNQIRINRDGFQKKPSDSIGLHAKISS